MKKFTLSFLKFLAIPFAGLLLGSNANAQTIYYQDFNHGIPSTYTLVDVDGLTPASGVLGFFPEFASKPWVAIDLTATDSAAISTSWYSPAGTADDWMITDTIFLPTTTDPILLSWVAAALDPDFADGYQVRISNTTKDVAGCLANPAIFTIAAESGTPTIHSVNLSSYAGDTVFIAFRNNSADMFVLMVDDIKVAIPAPYDIALVSGGTTANQFTLIPATQGKFDVKATIENLGGLAPADVKVVATFKNGNTVVYTDSVTVAGPATGAKVTVTMPTQLTLAAAASLTSEITAKIAEVDGDLLNNTITSSFDVNISDTTYSRDNGFTDPQYGGIGFNASGVPGVLGQIFTLTAKDTLTSLTGHILFGQGTTSGEVTGAVYNFNGSQPTTMIAQTAKVKMTGSNFEGDVTPIFSGGVILDPGTYFFAFQQHTAGTFIGVSPEIFTPGTTFLKSATGTSYSTLEANNRLVPFMVRPNFGTIKTVGINTNNKLEASVEVFPNPSTGVFNLTINDKAAADYSVVVTDIVGKEVSRVSLNDVTNGQFILDLTNEANGMYFVKVQSGDKMVTKKVTITK